MKILSWVTLLEQSSRTECYQLCVIVTYIAHRVEALENVSNIFIFLLLLLCYTHITSKQIFLNIKSAHSPEFLPQYLCLVSLREQN